LWHIAFPLAPFAAIASFSSERTAVNTIVELEKLADLKQKLNRCRDSFSQVTLLSLVQLCNLTKKDALMYSPLLQAFALNNSSTGRLLRPGLLFQVVALALLTFALTARAVTPAPDGGYPNNNTAEGDNALLKLTTGDDNTAIGFDALRSNTSGIFNTATGSGALRNNTGGNYNTANGFFALFYSTGTYNTATGAYALFGCMSESCSISTGFGNTATGFNALSQNTTGSGNIALGYNAGLNLTSGSNNIDIGNVGVAGEANKIHIGKTGTQTATFIAGIRGVTVPSGVGVIIGSNGQLGTATSSARFKEAIKPMDKTSEAILSLQPVTFRYKQELDPDAIPQFGLVAEQVEKVNPDLVVRDTDGKVMTVRYEAVNAMLLNEFLKEHGKVQELEKQVAALTAGLQKVTAALETRNRASDVAISRK